MHMLRNFTHTQTGLFGSQTQGPDLGTAKTGIPLHLPELRFDGVENDSKLPQSLRSAFIGIHSRRRIIHKHVGSLVRNMTYLTGIAFSWLDAKSCVRTRFINISSKV